MADTLWQIVTEARSYIQDTDGPHYDNQTDPPDDSFRYSDTDLVRYLNRAMTEIYRLRPDYYYHLASVEYDATNPGYYSYVPPSYTTADLAAGTEFPLDEKLTAAVAYFVAASAALRDDEHVVDARAAGFMQLFRQILGGIK